MQGAQDLASFPARRAHSALLSATPRDLPRRKYPSFGCSQGTTSQISKVPVVSAKSRHWWVPACRAGRAPYYQYTTVIYLTQIVVLGGFVGVISWGDEVRLLVSYRPLAQFSSFSSRRNEAAVARVPADRRFILDINRPESMDARALARYLGRPVPAFRSIPISALNFCSYDGVLRGPFGFRLSADELKHSSVRSIDHK